MSVANTIQTNFTAGEVTPLLKGRVDLAKYFNGVAEMYNFLCKPQGAAFRRPPTKYIGSTKNSAKQAVLVPFVFSNTQAYILEFGEYYIRFYRDGGQLTSGGTPVEVVTTYAEADLDQLRFSQSADVLYLTHKDYKPKTLSRNSDISWTLSDYVHTDGPYLDLDDSDTTLSLKNIVYRATIKSTASDFALGDVNKYIEYYDEGFLVIGQIKTFVSATEVTIEPKDNVVAASSIDERAVVEYAAADSTFPNRLRASTTIWGAESENSYIKVGSTWYLTGEHLAENEEIPEIPAAGTPPPNKQPAYGVDLMEVASTPTMLSTSGTLTISNKLITADILASEDVFDGATDIGRLIRLEFNSNWIWGTITAVTDAKNADVTLKKLPPLDVKHPGSYVNDAKTPNWRLGAWYVGNYPGVSTFHEQRLVFAGTNLEPQTIWMTKAGEFNNFEPTEPDSQVLDNNAVTRTIGSTTVNTIVWLQSGPTLLIGTIGEEFQGKPSSISEPISPSNFQITPQTAHGSTNYTRPIRVGSATLFLQRAGKKLRELTYSFEIDAFTAQLMTILSEHIFRKYGGGIKVAFQAEPDNILWVVCTTGELVACTYERDQQVVAFHHHNVSGVVESIAVIPSPTADDDELWLIVKRTINGSTVRYVERMDTQFEPLDEDDKDNMIFMDSYLTYSGVAASTISGLSHLEGEEVTIVADGAQHPNRTVSGGQITLDDEFSLVHVGLGYTSRLKLLPPEGGSAYGTSAGKNKKINFVDIRVHNSLNMLVGFDGDLTREEFREDDDPMDASPPLKTKSIRIIPDVGFDTDSQLIIEQDQPYPLTILNVSLQLSTNE